MILNFFNANITFNYEVEKDCKLPFLDVLLIKKGNNNITTVYRKATTNDIYLNWKSFAPTTWRYIKDTSVTVHTLFVQVLHLGRKKSII